MFVVTNTCLLQQKFWCDKRRVLSQQTCICRDKSKLVETEVQNYIPCDKSFVMTKTCLLQQADFCCDKNVFCQMTNLCCYLLQLLPINFSFLCHSNTGIVLLGFLKSCNIELDGNNTPIFTSAHETSVPALYMVGDIVFNGGGSIAMAINHAHDVLTDIKSKQQTS